MQSPRLATPHSVFPMIGRTANAHTSQRSEQRFVVHDSLLRPGDELPLASHLVTPRALYTHHGIYVGNGRVIHYAGLAYCWRRRSVEDVPLERFAHGHSIRVRRDRRRFDPRAVVERARSRLGERSYRLLTNNCEHFCAWALRDESRSSQVERLRAIPRAMCRVLSTLLQSIGPSVRERVGDPFATWMPGTRRGNQRDTAFCIPPDKGPHSCLRSRVVEPYSGSVWIHNADFDHGSSLRYFVPAASAKRALRPSRPVLSNLDIWSLTTMAG